MDPQNPVIPGRPPVPRNKVPGSEDRARPSLLEGITLKMTAKGKHYWDIQAYGELSQGLVLKIKEIDNYLKEEFPENVLSEE